MYDKLFHIPKPNQNYRGSFKSCQYYVLPFVENFF